jgi:hypothetical protein
VLSLLICRVFTSHCLVTAFNSERSPYSGFPKYPRASATRCYQQQLTRAEPHSLTHSLTHSPTNSLHFTQLNSTALRWKSKLCYARRSVGQSVFASNTHLGLKTRFLFLSDSCGFVDVGHPFWQENGFFFYNYAGPRQRSHSQVRVPGTHYHILLSQIRDCPNLEGQVPVFISPMNRETHLYPQELGSLFVAFYVS